MKKFLLEKKYSWSTMFIIIMSYCFDNVLFRFLFLIVGCIITIRLAEIYEQKKSIKGYEKNDKSFDYLINSFGGGKDGK